MVVEVVVVVDVVVVEVVVVVVVVEVEGGSQTLCVVDTKKKIIESANEEHNK